MPSTSFNGSSFTAYLSEAKAGDTYTVCVLIQDGNCVASNSVTVMGMFEKLKQVLC